MSAGYVAVHATDDKAPTAPAASLAESAAASSMITGVPHRAKPSRTNSGLHPPHAFGGVAMTPFGARLRGLRAERGVTLRQLAAELQVSAAYLSALEHGKRSAPSVGLVHQVNEFFGLIWDDADELARLARLSRPRVLVDTSGLTPEQTALANRLAQTIRRLPPETVASIHATLDATAPQPKPRLRRAARRTTPLPLREGGRGKGVGTPDRLPHAGGRPTVRTLLVVCHSRTGGARQMAEAARRGASLEAEVTVRLLPAPQAQASDVLAADGYIFATPENLAALAGQMKEFFDRTYYAVLDRINGRPYAALICAGSDGHNAARQIARIATGWRLRAIAEPLIVCTHAQTPETILAPTIIDRTELIRCEEVGAALAMGIAAGIF